MHGQPSVLLFSPTHTSLVRTRCGAVLQSSALEGGCLVDIDKLVFVMDEYVSVLNQKNFNMLGQYCVCNCENVIELQSLND
jgi:hypothetical protein